MAVAVDDTEQIIDDTGDTYIVPSEPSDPLLLSMWLNTKSSATVGTVTHTIGGQAFENNEGVDANGSSSPYIHASAYWTTGAGTWPSTGSQTVVLTSTTAFANEGICIVSLSGVHQTTPISDFQSGKLAGAASTFPSFTISADVGDMVYAIYSCDSDGTINTPSAPGTNSWTDANSGTSIIGGSMSRHRVFRMDVSDDISSQSITNSTTTNENNRAAMIVVIEQSVGGGATNPKGPLGMPFRGPFGGPI